MRSEVLVVVGRPHLGETVASRLRDEYDVRTVHCVDAARERLESEVAVAILDRALPDRSKREFFEYVDESDSECCVAVLSDPDSRAHPVENEADATLEEPIVEGELRETVDRLSVRAQYDAKLETYFSLAVERAQLASDDDDDGGDLRELSRELERLGDELDSLLEELETEAAIEIALEEEFGDRNGNGK